MRVFLVLLAAMVSLVAADPFAGLRFTDGKEHSLGEFPGQAVVVVYFCGHCPGARAFMGKDPVAIAALIEGDRLAAQLVCITPDLQGTELTDYIKDAAPALLGTALIAYDPLNPGKIGLQNILQSQLYVDGAPAFLGFDRLLAEAEPVLRASKGWRYPIDGIEGKSRDLWWGVERGKPGALKAALAAKKDPAVAKILAAVQTKLDQRQDTLVAAPADLATYEQLEALLAEGEGMELKPANERIKVLAKDPVIKKELQARTLYRECKRQVMSKKAKEQEAGKANLAQLAAKMPDTVYGKRAAAH